MAFAFELPVGLRRGIYSASKLIEQWLTTGNYVQEKYFFFIDIFKQSLVLFFGSFVASL